ncbi:hypothetical protein LOK49_Contig46G00003 [Camellia lanceoleosa]|nr:hypothetical protein LOK49_Contig46G00003 [Camellia lanceoleosa]
MSEHCYSVVSFGGCHEYKVQCGKLVETLTECHNLKLATAAIEPKECGRFIMDVDPPEVCDERRTVIETVDVGSIESSFSCWQAGTKIVGNMKIEGGNDYDNKNTGTPTSKEKVVGKIASRGEVWPILFLDLLELSSTPDCEGVGQEQGGANDELLACKVRIAELESEINLNTVVVNRDSEIARLSKQVDRLEARIGNLEDSLDDLEVHEVTQFVVNDGSNQRTPSNSLSGKVSASGNVTSGESAQQSACLAIQLDDVGITELQIADTETGIEDLTDDFAQWNAHTTVQGVEGSCSLLSAHPVSAGNVIDAYAAMLTEMHKTVSGSSEYVGTSYIYTSVCSVVDHHSQFVKPRVTAAGVRADLFDGSFVSVVDCPQQVPESSDCGIFVCFIIRQYIRGAEVNTMMDGLTPTGLRAAMVDMFLSDPGRGLRGRTL